MRNHETLLVACLMLVTLQKAAQTVRRCKHGSMWRYLSLITPDSITESLQPVFSQGKTV